MQFIVKSKESSSTVNFGGNAQINTAIQNDKQYAHIKAEYKFLQEGRECASARYEKKAGAREIEIQYERNGIQYFLRKDIVLGDTNDGEAKVDLLDVMFNQSGSFTQRVNDSLEDSIRVTIKDMQGEELGEIGTISESEGYLGITFQGQTYVVLAIQKGFKKVYGLVQKGQLLAVLDIERKLLSKQYHVYYAEESLFDILAFLVLDVDIEGLETYLCSAGIDKEQIEQFMQVN